MVTRTQLAAYLDDYLSVGRFDDYAPNGLQVEGRERIARICSAVTASEAVIESACLMKADALLVHHGYFWKGEDPVICGMKRRRLGRLIVNDLNLFAYHLPLDCHPTLGNNARIGSILQVVDVKADAWRKNPDLLWSGQMPAPVSVPVFFDKLSQAFHRPPLHVAGSNKPILRVAWCSGGAQDLIEDAAKLGVDAFISGEIAERTYYQANELGIHYFACGHHATERFGVQALGEHLSQMFNLDHVFIDSDNPV